MNNKIKVTILEDDILASETLAEEELLRRGFSRLRDGILYSERDNRFVVYTRIPDGKYRLSTIYSKQNFDRIFRGGK